MRNRLTSILAVIGLLETAFASPQATGVRSVLFAGGNASVRIPNAPQVSTSLTVEAWVYPMTMQESDAVIFRRITPDLASPFFTYSLHLHRDTPNDLPAAVFAIALGLPASVFSVNSGEVKIPFFAWTHLAGVFDGTSIAIYVNGAKMREVAVGGSTPAGGIIRLGISVVPQVGSRYVGLVDEMRHWNVARTQAEIQGAMEGIDTPASALGLIGYWRFEEASGITVFDSSPQGNHGQYLSVRTEAFSPFDPAGTPSLSAVPTSVDLRALEVGEPVQVQITISNVGNATLVGFILAEGTITPFGGVSRLASAYVIAAGQSLVQTITLTVLSAGIINEKLSVHSNDPGSPFLISVTGTALAVHTFDANNISMFVLRNGRTARNPLTRGAGFEWPKGSGKTAVFQIGLFLAAKVDGDVRSAAAHFETEYQPGPAPGGIPVDPANTKFRVYKIARGDNAATNPDFAEWPADLGAPVNADGSPRLLGDQTLFAVYNDLNPARHRPPIGKGSQPLGAEVQQTVYGFTTTGTLNNTAFIHYRITNRSNQTWTNAFVGLWSDPDLGNHLDDLVGCDVDRDLGYLYNATPSDAVYGSNPPAVGYIYLQGVAQKPLQAFTFHAPPSLPDPMTSAHVYNYLRGLRHDGSSYINPTTGLPTVYALSGDPITGIGWVDSNPSDRRLVISSGPFDLTPGESKAVDFAVVVGQGSTNLNSIVALRSDVDQVRSFFGVLSVAVDIKPQSCPNPLNPRAKGVLPVAVLGTAEFDVREIDVSSVRLEGVAPLRAQIEDVTRPINGKTEDCRCTAEGPDRFVDLSMHFDIPAIVAALGPLTDGEVRVLTLTGRLRSGKRIEGKDCVVIRAGGSGRQSVAEGEDGNSIDQLMPTEYALYQAYPNPFNPATTIQYDLPEPSFVTLKVFDMLGREVVELVQGHQQARRHSVQFNAGGLPSGVYIYRLEAGKFVATKKLMLTK